MIIGIGTDIIEVARIQKMIDEYSEHATNKIFTPLEVEYSNSFGKRKYEHFAARFAVKEAFSKAIGTGLTKHFSFQEVEIQNLDTGQPIIILKGELQKIYGHYKIHLTIAHTIENAIAFVVIEE